MTFFKKLLTLFCLVFPLLSFAMEDPWLILEKSAKASQQLNYEGVFHSQSSSESNSTHVIHANIDNKEILKVGTPLVLQYVISVTTWLVFFIFIENLHNANAKAISNTMRNVFGIIGVFV